jgi:hypothetical protein
MCPEKEALSAFIDGEIEAPWHAEIEEHLQSCVLCRSAVQALLDLGNLVRTAEEPDHASAMAAVERRIADMRNLSDQRRGSFWRRPITIPMPVAGMAAALIIFLGTAYAVTFMRREFRPVMIKIQPSGVTEVQISAPVADIEKLLKSLEKGDSSLNDVWQLPKNSRFSKVGEPTFLRETDFTGKKTW